MIVLCTFPGCNSSKKAKNWLKDKEIEFVEKNIYKVLLDENEFNKLFSSLEKNELVNISSKYLKDNNIDIMTFNVTDLYRLIKNNPSLLKKPIILSDKNNNILDDDNICMLKTIIKCDNNCSHFDCCGALNK